MVNPYKRYPKTMYTATFLVVAGLGAAAAFVFAPVAFLAVATSAAAFWTAAAVTGVAVVAGLFAGIKAAFSALSKKAPNQEECLLPQTSHVSSVNDEPSVVAPTFTANMQDGVHSAPANGSMFAQPGLRRAKVDAAVLEQELGDDVSAYQFPG